LSENAQFGIKCYWSIASRLEGLEAIRLGCLEVGMLVCWEAKRIQAILVI